MDKTKSKAKVDRKAKLQELKRLAKKYGYSLKKIEENAE